MTWYNWIGTIVSFLLIACGLIHLFRVSIHSNYSVKELFQLKGQLPEWRIHWPDIAFLFIFIFAIHILGVRYLPSLFPEEFTYMLPTALAAGSISILILYRLYQRFVLPQDQRIPVNTKATDFKEDLKLAVSSFFILIAIIVMLNSIWNLGIMLITGKTLGELPTKAAYIMALNVSNPVPLKAAIILICLCIIPFVDEFIFRAGLYRALKSKMPQNTAIVLSSVGYSIFLLNISNFPANIATGIALCILYERTGNIKAPLMLNVLLAIKTCLLAILLS